MIQLLEGTPGSGKSYHAVKEYLLPWVRSGRRLYVAVDGFYLDRLAVFENRELADLEKQVTLWNDLVAIPSLLLSVQPGSAVILDEAQTIFRAKEKVPGEVLRWLETHRHIGVDVLLMAQDYRQITGGVTRLVETTIKFRRMERFGLKKRYQGFIRGNPEETEVIRTLVGRYDPKVYSYYSSYVGGAREERKVRSVMGAPTVLVGLIGLAGAVAFFTWGSWLNPAPVKALPPPVSKSELSLLESKLSEKSSAAGADLSPVATEKLHIQGGMTVGGKTYWVTSEGKILSTDQVAIMSNGPVTERKTDGVPLLSGLNIVMGEDEIEASIMEALPIRQPLDLPVLKHSSLFKKRSERNDVKCIGVDGKERVCDGSSSY